ncbi:hypothetical protein JBL43_15700 [Aureibaculum sp. A20]|uniref:Uncharacterized protein n=1 Tax=Aureibaculum flavum TaxID=2795986 RepID=A0ABS0WUN2_9FLAO|nr:DUF6620 family protein [Aureibaculum flavum]MBJ2175697.1 hypothetical protein [Aureibaculum flavum]
MEINGVSFRDYACASANLVAGMSLEDVCKVLSLEVPVWEDTKNQWNGKMAEMSMDDMQFYGEVFTNPKQGKFANVVGGAEGPEVVLAKFPEWSDYIKMEQHMSVAHEYGIDIDLDKEYGISLTEYSQLAMHWSGYWKKYVIDVETQTSQEMINGVEFSEAQKEASRIFKLNGELTDKWENHFKEIYKNKGAGLSDDIDF